MLGVTEPFPGFLMPWLVFLCLLPSPPEILEPAHVVLSHMCVRGPAWQTLTMEPTDPCDSGQGDPWP